MGNGGIGLALQWILGLLVTIAMGISAWTAHQLDTKVNHREVETMRSRLVRIEDKLDRQNTLIVRLLEANTRRRGQFDYDGDN